MSELKDKVVNLDSLKALHDYSKETYATKSQVGSPLTASTAAAMTDTTKIYVYTGSEQGYTNGHWYYYDGSAWADGGVYNSMALQTDTTLTVSGAAADAKATGDELSDLKSALRDISNIAYTKGSGYIANGGSISPASSNNEVYTSKIPAIAGQSFAFSFKSSTTDLGNWCAYALYDGNDNFITRTVFISNVLGKEVSQIVTIPQTSQNSNARYISFTWRNFADGAEAITIADLNNALSQVKSECIAPLILSQAKNYVDITITDTASSIKLPADVLACTNTGYVQITATETEIDISSSVIATTAIKVVFNLSTKQFELCAYNIPLNPQQILIASIRRHTANPSVFIGCNYILNGKPFGKTVVVLLLERYAVKLEIEGAE